MRGKWGPAMGQTLQRKHAGCADVPTFSGLSRHEGGDMRGVPTCGLSTFLKNSPGSFSSVLPVFGRRFCFGRWFA